MAVSRAIGLKAPTLVAMLLVAGLFVLGVHGADVETAAKVVAADGQVSVLRNSELWVLSTDSLVRVGETIVTGPQGYARLQISDGSTFDVYPSSRVVFRANPGNLRDLLEVFLGNVKVHIQTYGGRPNPYRVHSPTAVIAVRGTIFEVGVEDDTVTSVTVDEGLVEVTHRLLPGGKAVPLMPGQSLRIFPNAALAASRIDKMSIAIRVANAARDALYTLPRIGGGRTPSGTPGGGGLPTDTGAPPPPPPQPTDKSAPAPPPPPGNP
jgi:hypothetical protein